MPKLTVTAKVYTDDIIERLVSDLDYNELIELIAAIDLRVADVDFTRKLHSWITEELVKEGVIRLDGKKDTTNECCTQESCPGRYYEMGIQDDMHGVLHCDTCGHETKRWQ